MRCAVLGDPVAHSLSPALHRAGYAACGLAWTYDARQVPAGRLVAELSRLRGSGQPWRGLSVTMPLKREALAAADRVSARAALVGAANTLLLVDGVHADNTDLPGALAALRERYDGSVSAATILGAGATAAATGLALCDAGARAVTLLARSPERAAATVAALERHPSAPAVRIEPFDGVPTGEVLVSTVPAAAQTPEVVARCAGAPVLLECVYDPWPTPLAAAAGGVVVSGLDLLVHQAARQFEIFTGLPAPVAAMRDAGSRALAARAGTRSGPRVVDER